MTSETGQDRSSANSSNTLNRQTAKQTEMDFTKMTYKIRHPHRTLRDFVGLSSSIQTPHNTWDAYLKEEHDRETMKIKTDVHASSMANKIGLSEVASRNAKKSKPQLSTMHGVGF